MKRKYILNDCRIKASGKKTCLNLMFHKEMNRILCLMTDNGTYAQNGNDESRNKNRHWINSNNDDCQVEVAFF